MNNENIKTNATVSENVENDLLTEKTNYGTINSADLISGKAELVLMQPFDDGNSGISVACVGGDSGSSNNSCDCYENGGSNNSGIRVYHRINSVSYRTIFDINGTRIDMKEFLSYC